LVPRRSGRLLCIDSQQYRRFLLSWFSNIMMASFMSYFGGRPDPKKSAREAILTLREQLNMIQKKQEYTQKKIDEDTKKAKLNAVTNKTGAFIPSLTSSVLWAISYRLIRQYANDQRRWLPCGGRSRTKQSWNDCLEWNYS
jgi:hypothetical protein